MISRSDLDRVVSSTTDFAREAGLAGRSVRYVLLNHELIPELEMRRNAELTMRALRIHPSRHGVGRAAAGCAPDHHGGQCVPFFGWLIEDFIDGIEVDAAEFRRYIRDHAASVYASTARLRLIKRSAGGTRLVQALERLRRSRRPFRRWPSGRLWPVGFAQNDLTADNLLSDAGGKFWLSDWEHAGVVPLVADLGRA